MAIQKQDDYDLLVEQISRTYTEGYVRVVKTTHKIILETYWRIGEYIVEYEQKGNPKAGYGLKLLANLARDLTLLHSKGFSRPNLSNMRLLYQRYPICQTMSDKLSWSHYVELISIQHSRREAIAVMTGEIDMEEIKRAAESLGRKWTVPENEPFGVGISQR